MSTKSAARREKDKARLEQMGKKRNTGANHQREVTARSWFELKAVHRRTSDYIMNTAVQLAKYSHPTVTLKIADNNDDAEFNAKASSIPVMIAPLQKDLAALWARHEHKKGRCIGMADIEEAFKLFEAYEALGVEFYSLVEPVITRLNEIYNKALKQLLNGDPTDKNTVAAAAAADAKVETQPEAEQASA